MATIDTYFRELKKQGASDLHMVIGFPPLLRMHGELKPTDQPVLTPDSNRGILYEILDPEQQAYLEKNRDFDMAYELGKYLNKIKLGIRFLTCSATRSGTTAGTNSTTS